MVDKLPEEGVDQGVSNGEIDWFLRDDRMSKYKPNINTNNQQQQNQQNNKPNHHDHKLEHNLHAHLIKDQSPSDSRENLHVLSRSKSLSEVDNPIEKKKGGFFRNLFSRKSNSKDKLNQIGNSQNNSNSDVSIAPNDTTTTTTTTTNQSISNELNSKRNITRSRSLSQSSSNGIIDPKLEEFLKYYKSKGIDKLHQDLERSSRRPSTSSISSPPSTTHQNKRRSVDCLGRPIPAHPDISSLPPAIIYDSKFETSLPQSSTTNIGQSSTSSKIGGFLRRHHQSNSEQSISRTNSISSSNDNNNKLSKSKQCKSQLSEQTPITIPGLENLPNLKRVAFDVPVFMNDPPQQIPSRSPRKGEVEILKDGSIVIHKLTAAERKQLLNNPGGGIVVGGSGHLKIISPTERKEESEKARKNIEPVIKEEDHENEEEEDNEKAAQKHSISVNASAAAAEARAKAAPNELKRIITNNEDEVQVSTDASKINIDKPMIRKNKSSASLLSTDKNSEQIEDDINEDEDENSINSKESSKVPLDVLYTRCCHLREILPIPATLKQITPGSTDPISLLQLRNPKPSLVEVLTFSDFVSVAPILCISLDGVALSSEMFRIILSSLLHKKELEKLTLRNTPIDEMGWKLLCWFLSKNHTLSRLDLTQCPNISTNVQKPSKAQSNIIRMECSMNDRSDMNWNLLNAALMSRKGIEELVISGAKMSNEECKNLFEMGISIKTSRIGLAFNDLTKEQCDIIAENVNLQNVIGIDLAFNDLNGKLGGFNKRVSTDDVSDSNLKFLSLNSTNLQNDNGELDELISTFAKFKDLRYIDLSNNEKIFPDLLTSLTENLPLYPKLARLHLDNNKLKPENIVALAELIPFCKSLTYFSLIGNHLDSVAASALTNALKISKSLITLDLNYDEIAPKFKETIGLYTVRNMQHQIYGKQSDPKELQGLQEELSHLLLSDGGNPDPKLIESFFTKAVKFRDRIHETIDELFKLRISGKLSTDGKETLIRFCFIDASIEKGLSLLGKKSAKYGVDTTKYLVPPMMKRTGSAVINESPYLSEHNHNELLPFGVTNTGQAGEIHVDAEEIKDEQRARAKDSNKLKEEASFLKLNHYIKNKMEENNVKPNIDDIQDISGEKFREILLQTNDLNNVVEVLDSIKKEGIPLEKIYERKDNNSSSADNHSPPLFMETLRNTKSNLSDRKTIVSDDEADSGSDADSFVSDDEKDGDINQAYDKILDHLERVRTNN
ncbi:MAP-ous protein 1 [Wickerhamomyces ciferrii]|uniref:MAP-ous protein 1 n=1 Tax=Wickerhamomyces ciferrii (strain ATCC 14091 / BCRC 22168 / CBS 111 / JCM 3599 / NBRC 0793 / NRRL Y-1031 F-60-10) TaxID=1206466 RepID=K0KTC2_WICCF|nr:MAP-ous protein 1 [Wickerhamomyces ciferrii]CCH45257.1 MAP-ous protein 1 [Wickerhamomyces ciferrii]